MRRDGMPETVNEFDSLLDRVRLRSPDVDAVADELYNAVQEDEQVPRAVSEVMRLALDEM